MPIGRPGWPLFAFSTASRERNRIALAIASWDTLVVIGDLLKNWAPAIRSSDFGGSNWIPDGTGASIRGGNRNLSIAVWAALTRRSSIA